MADKIVCRQLHANPIVCSVGHTTEKTRWFELLESGE